MTAQLDRIEVVEDRSATADPTQGFLRLRRLILRNHYADGTTSQTYPCDLVSRCYPDAVTVVIYEIDDKRQVHVVLRTGVRPPVYLRRDHPGLARPETRDVRLLTELVAGLLEPVDAKPGGVAHRARLECAEEVGIDVAEDAIRALGASMYASPGVTDEQVFYRCVETDVHARTDPEGDGSIMEEAGETIILPLDEAIHRCRSGDITDTKTELGLLRLCDAIGYSAQLGCFLDELPATVSVAKDRLAWLMGAREDPA